MKTTSSKVRGKSKQPLMRKRETFKFRGV